MADFLYAVLVVEVAIILFVAGLWTVGYVVVRIDKWRHPVYPCCGIDPRCHPAYHNGWIGKYKVRNHG